jgi:hypothetical protein
VDAGSFLASSAGPGAVNAGFFSRPWSVALRDDDWVDALAVLPEPPVLVVPLPELDDELQAAVSSSAPAASTAPATAGRTRRDDLACLVAVGGVLNVAVICPTYLRRL